MEVGRHFIGMRGKLSSARGWERRRQPLMEAMVRRPFLGRGSDGAGWFVRRECKRRHQGAQGGEREGQATLGWEAEGHRQGDASPAWVPAVLWLEVGDTPDR